MSSMPDENARRRRRIRRVADAGEASMVLPACYRESWGDGH